MEFRFEASGTEDASEELRSLLSWLSDERGFGSQVRITPEHAATASGTMSDALTAFVAVVSAATSVTELAHAITRWRESRPPGVGSQIAVAGGPAKQRRKLRRALEAPPESRTEASDRSDDYLSPIDPGRSACVLIGVDAYTELDTLKAVQHNLEQLHEVLSDERIVGLSSDRIHVVENPKTPADLVGPIYDMAELADDALIVYYAGHGLIDLHDDRLYLTLPDSLQHRPDTAAAFDLVRRALRDSKANRRVAILDCCYSGKALMRMATDSGVNVAASLSEVNGSYLMTATPENRKAHAPDRRTSTVFTAALVKVLRTGVPDGPERLTLNRVFHLVRGELGDNWPAPQQQDRNGVGESPFARNRALTPVEPDEPQLAPPRRRRRVGLLLFAGGVAFGLLAWLLVPPGLELVWKTPAVGPCSARADLLSYSDDLDKKEVSLERVYDLSALALAGQSTAWTLTDDEEVRLFPINLGPIDALRPRADTPLTLRDADGQPYLAGIDGEALVVERGGDTVLIGSETEPAIRRFRLDTGEEVGEPLPIPTRLRTAPVGKAQIGRTIEALTASPDGRYLYAGWESPLSIDGDARGSHLLRIQRYTGEPGGQYIPDRQYAYLTDPGLHLTELAVIGANRLLALEREYIQGVGNTVRVFDVRLRGAPDVTARSSLHHEWSTLTVDRKLVFDLGDCPPGSPGVVESAGPQANPLLGNVEGMALGEPLTTGPHARRRPLYLVTDDNGSPQQITRFYSLAVDVD